MDDGKREVENVNVGRSDGWEISVEEDCMEDAWKWLANNVHCSRAHDYPIVPRTMSLTHVGSANIERMYSGGLGCSMAAVSFDQRLPILLLKLPYLYEEQQVITWGGAQ